MRSTWPTERTIIPKDGRYGFTQPHSSASSLQATSQCVAAVCGGGGGGSGGGSSGGVSAAAVHEQPLRASGGDAR